MIHSAGISSVNLVLFRPIRSRLLINPDSTNQVSINPSTNQMLVLLRQQYLDQLQLRTVLSVLKYHGAMIHLPLLQLQLLQLWLLLLLCFLLVLYLLQLAAAAPAMTAAAG